MADRDDARPSAWAGELVDLFRRLRAASTGDRPDRPPTLQWIAARSGYAVGHVSEVLRARKRPSPDAAEAIATVLGAGPDDRRLARFYAEQMSPPDLQRPAPSARPAMLPPAPSAFAGRAADLTRLQDGPLVGITGIGGIGKTWLALHWARSRASGYPDGNLYADLRGFAPHTDAATTEDTIRTFLGALGVPAASIPAAPPEQAALYRSLTAGLRLLILLDNARDADQVHELLPGDGPATVLVTSRTDLAGLVVRHGARVLRLDTMAPAEATELLVAHLGKDRVAGEPFAVRALIAACAGLPLALGIVAARAAGHPQWPLSWLATELRDDATRLDAFDVGDVQVNLRAVFSWSYRLLDRPAARVFGLLGLVPGGTLTAEVAAGAGSLDLTAAGRVLRELEGAGFLEQPEPGRYHMHDLLRLYATERGREDLPEADRDAALDRLTDGALHTAYHGERVLAPHRPDIALAPPAPGSVVREPAGTQDALSWFDTEHHRLSALQEIAADRGRDTVVWQLAWAQDNYHYRRGLLSDQRRAWEHGLAAAGRLTDPAPLALARLCLGNVCTRAGRLRQARDLLGLAMAEFEREGDRAGQAQAHRALALSWAQSGDHRPALEHATKALELFTALGEDQWTAIALNAVGEHHALLGETDQARSCSERALELHRRYRNRPGEAATLDTLGITEQVAGRWPEAAEYLRSARAIYRDLGHAYSEADTSARLGEVLAAAGDAEGAIEAWHEALDLFEQQQRRSDAVKVRRHLDAA